MLVVVNHICDLPKKCHDERVRDKIMIRLLRLYILILMIKYFYIIVLNKLFYTF